MKKLTTSDFEAKKKLDLEIFKYHINICQENHKIENYKEIYESDFILKLNDNNTFLYGAFDNIYFGKTIIQRNNYGF